MARIRSTIIENNDPAAVSSRLRYFSMLSMISLHRVVFDLVERDSMPLYGSIPAIVQLAADILVGCVGPLGRAVITDSKSMNESKVRQTWTSLVECFMRGISALEMLGSKLSTGSTSANYLQRANSAINDLADTLDRKRGRLKAPRDTAENAAKVR
jgi:glucose uptake protein GlcU